MLLVMHDTELLDVLKITCEVVGDQQADLKSNSQTIQPSNGSSCKANKGQQIKTDISGVNDANSNMSDYFRSSINRAADRRASMLLMKTMHEFSDVLSEVGCFEGTFNLQVKDGSWPYQAPPGK